MGIIAVVMVFRIRFGLNERSCTKLKESILKGNSLLWACPNMS